MTENQPQPLSRKAKVSTWLVMFVIMILAFYLKSRGIPLWKFLGGMFALVVVSVLGRVFWIRWKWRVWHRGKKLIKDGDLDQAITLMEREIEKKGETAQRLNILYVWYSEAKRWEDALAGVERAAELGEMPLISRSNRAYFLKHLGRVEESLQIVDEVLQEHPDEFLLQARYCIWLREAGRVEEAHERYAIAEALSESGVQGHFPQDEERRAELLAECREALAGDGR